MAESNGILGNESRSTAKVDPEHKSVGYTSAKQIQNERQSVRGLRFFILRVGLWEL